MNNELAFLRRFDALWARLIRFRALQAVAWTMVGATAAYFILAMLDYTWELPFAWRRWALGFALGAVAGLAIAFVARLRRTGSRPKTASMLEAAFPQLGQSVRTTVQFAAEQIDADAAGVRPGLLSALRHDTHARSRMLPFDRLVPTRGLAATAAMVAVSWMLFAAAAWFNPEWRVAGARALLATTDYTTVEAAIETHVIDEGDSVALVLRVVGRLPRDVAIHTRPADRDDAPATVRTLAASQARRVAAHIAEFTVTHDNVKSSFVWHGVAGRHASRPASVRVRRPLAIEETAVEVAPPEYTGQPSAVTRDLNLSAVEGSSAHWRITFDQPVRSASLVLTDRSREAGRSDEPPAVETIALSIHDRVAEGRMALEHDWSYSVAAETADGVRLPHVAYRVRVRPDQAPEVYFEQPMDPIEVHTLAELVMRLRIRDDFGLTRAGIMFEVNNEEEIPLMLEDVPPLPNESGEGRPVPRLQAVFEKTLPLEHFQLTQKDSVAYYAFAEDNFPGAPRRAVTDLRFVDIRPFRSEYRLFDPMAMGGGGGGPRLASLEEIISRQRNNLNRTMTLDRQLQQGRGVDLSHVDSIASSESELAQATRQLAEFLGNFMNSDLDDEIQLLLQAETNMLAAVDSLQAGNYANSVLKQRDALKDLIEGRDRLRIAILKNPQKFPGLRAADRRLSQKLRRPKSDREAALAVIQRLKSLAANQAGVRGGLMAWRTPDSPDPTEPMPPARSGAAAEKSSPSESPAATGDPQRPNDDAQPATAPSEKPTAPPSESPNPSIDAADSTMPAEAPRASGRPSAQELRDQQLDLVLEAADLVKAVDGLKDATELAKTRMHGIADLLDQVAAAVDRMDLDAAIPQSRDVEDQAIELAHHLEATLAKEAAERLAAARNMAAQLARQQEGLMNRAQGGNPQTPPVDPANMPPNAGQPNMNPPNGQSPMAAANSGQSGTGQRGDNPPNMASPNVQAGNGQRPSDAPPSKDATSNEPSSNVGESLADDVRRQIAAAESLLDVLRSVASSADPGDADAAGKVRELLQGDKLESALQGMAGWGELVRNDQRAALAEASGEMAERLDVAASKLGGLARQLAAPKLDELIRLEARLAELNRQLQEMTDTPQSQRAGLLRRDAERLLDQAERAGIGEKTIARARELLGGGSGEPKDDQRGDGSGAPTSDGMGRGGAWNTLFGEVSEELQARIQELLLGEVLSGQEDAAPLLYEELVQRYYEVLARQKRPAREPRSR